MIDEHRPELATQYCRPLSSSNVTPKALSLRPSLLLPTPSRLKEKVPIEHGPEPIVSGWWDTHEITRDYFIARDDNGRWLWVYRTPQQEWFTHGFFS